MPFDAFIEKINSLEDKCRALENKLLFFEVAIKRTPQHIWMLNEQGQMLAASDALNLFLSRLTNVDLKDFSGINIYELIGKVSPEPFVEMIRRNDQLTRERDATMVFEEVAQIGDDIRTYLSYKKRLVHPQTGEKFLLGISIDISERKKMEVEMLNMMKEMEMADKTKRTFIQNFRHDLKTPVSNIVGAADLLLHSSQKDELPFFLESIKTSGMQLMSYIDHLTEVSVTQKVNLPIDIQKVNLREEVASVLNGLTAISRAKSLGLTMEFTDNVPDEIEIDQLRIHRIMANLLGNALKYTDEGSVHISVDYITTNAGSVLEMHVIDTGVGIEDKFQQLIFSPMMRIRNDNGNESEGAGLGLSIVREFINDLGGQIAVSSTPGEGARFIVMIPLQDSASN